MMKRYILPAALLLAALLLGGCGAQTPADGGSAPAPEAQAETPAETPAAPMAVSSDAVQGGVLADAYGAKGSDFESGWIPSRSLPLTVENLPEGTVALAVLMTDPDADGWVHWAAANLPAGDVPDNAGVALADSIVQGLNSFGTVGYGGPTPPSGTHTYVVTVYALREELPLENGFSQDALTDALDGRVLAQAQLTAQYSK